MRYVTERIDIYDPNSVVTPATASHHFELLRRFVQDTYLSCSYWRRRMAAARFEPDQLRDLDGFAKVPALSPIDATNLAVDALLPDAIGLALRRNEPIPAELAIVRRFQTSSSTGRPKVSYYTRDDWDANCANTIRVHSDIPFPDRSRIYNLFHAGHYGGKNVEDSFCRTGAVVVNRHFASGSPEDVIREMTTELRELDGFNGLALPPCGVESVAKGVNLDTLLDFDHDNFIGKHVRMVTLGGSCVPPEMRLKERLWEANALAGNDPARYVFKYGASEVGIVAIECTVPGRFHVVQGSVYTEVINEATGVHVRSGETGLVAMTGLRQGSRFLRYLVGDQARYFDEPCMCGHAGPQICDIERVSDLERLTSGCAAGGAFT